MAKTIAARNETDLVEAFLRHAIQMRAASEPEVGTSAGLIGFRATARDLPGLLGAALDAAFGEAEAQGFGILDVEVSGVMAIDAGMRCWGTVDVATGSGSSSMPILRQSPIVRREGTHLIASVDIVLATEEEFES